MAFLHPFPFSIIPRTRIGYGGVSWDDKARTRTGRSPLSHRRASSFISPPGMLSMGLFPFRDLGVGHPSYLFLDMNVGPTHPISAQVVTPPDRKGRQTKSMGWRLVCTSRRGSFVVALCFGWGGTFRGADMESRLSSEQPREGPAGLLERTGNRNSMDNSERAIPNV